MLELEKVRIDKWLWAVRIFKTRTLAAEACNKGHVKIGEMPAKPSRELKGGEVVKVRIAPIEREYRVQQLTDKKNPYIKLKMINKYYDLFQIIHHIYLFYLSKTTVDIRHTLYPISIPDAFPWCN